MKRLIISPLVLALVLVSPLSAPVGAAGSVDPGAGVDLTPSGDVAATNVVPVVAGSAVKGGSLWAQVDDGTSFSAADDSATLVRTRLRFKGAEHTTSYAGAPPGTVTDVVVNLRAARSPLARGTARVRLYDGSTLLGSSAPHALTEAYTNFSDDFGGLSVADASNLRTTVKFTNTSGKGELFYTALWLHAAYQTASDSPPSVSILSPTDGAAVSGPIVVSGTSGDDVGVSSVSLRIDGGAPIALSTAGTWTYPWDTTGADGTHQLTVTATDTAGQTSSQSISVDRRGRDQLRSASERRLLQPSACRLLVGAARRRAVRVDGSPLHVGAAAGKLRGQPHGGRPGEGQRRVCSTPPGRRR